MLQAFSIVYYIGVCVCVCVCVCVRARVWVYVCVPQSKPFIYLFSLQECNCLVSLFMVVISKQQISAFLRNLKHN